MCEQFLLFAESKALPGQKSTTIELTQMVPVATPAES